MENKVNYNIIKYLKDLANKRNDATLQTGVEYLTTAFNLSLNEENDKQYVVHDFHTLLEHAVGSSQKSTSSTSSGTSDVDKKFEDYKKILSSKNYFGGTTEGSQEYNDRLQKAKEKFYEKYKTDNPNTNTNTTTSFGSDEDKKKNLKNLKFKVTKNSNSKNIKQLFNVTLTLSNFILILFITTIEELLIRKLINIKTQLMIIKNVFQ